jgi:hypothetical protein
VNRYFVPQALTFAACFTLVNLPSLAAAPRLEVPVVVNNTLTLRLFGDVGVAHRIEASTNLTSWITVAGGVLGDGPLIFQLGTSGTFPWNFFRGVKDSTGGATFPTVQPQVDTNATASVVLVPDRETTLQLPTASQAVLTLSFPAGSVSEPTLVTLTSLASTTGLPNQQGLLAGARLEPAGLVLLAPAFLQIDFPEPIDAQHISSFAFNNDGSDLHLVPDAVTSNITTHRVRILVQQLRSHGCGVFTLPELRSLAATRPPARSAPSRAGLHADMAGCYPEDEKEAKAMQEELEDSVRPRQQAAAAILGEERQKQLLGYSDESVGNTALIRVLQDSANFYETEIKGRLPQALESCAGVQTLTPWALGFERQRQLLGGGESATEAPLSNELICQGSLRCQQQAVECCRTQGGDTRLVRTLLGIERQRALLGAGAECGEISVEQVLKDCAPDWYGTLTIRVSGRYLNLRTNGNWHIRRTKQSDMVLTATVLSAKVRTHAASIFAPAYTNITCVLGGQQVSSDDMEKLEQNRESSCQGKPSQQRRDHWTSSGQGSLSDIELDAIIMNPNASSLFIKPYLRVTDGGVPIDMRWFYEESTTTRSQFSDEDCETTVRTGGSYDPEAGSARFQVSAGPEEFTWTADTLQYSFSGPESMRFDFEHLFEGTREVQLQLRRVK